MNPPRVRIYLDDDREPMIDEALPTDVALDTSALQDGPHRITVRATDQNGNEGTELIDFQVRNGPGIVLSGLKPNSVRRGTVHFSVDAFSADDPFDPRRAEARSSIPTWVFVMCLFIVGWAVWYAASMWDVPADLRNTPTYGSSAAVVEPAPSAAALASQAIVPAADQAPGKKF